MGLSPACKWTKRTEPGTLYTYTLGHLNGWRISINHTPDNMGNIEWRVWNEAILGVVEVHGRSLTINEASRAAVAVVDHIEEL